MHHTHYRVQEWNPRLQEVADTLIAGIHEVIPELEVFFIGAAALGLPGKNDIDLDILCRQADIPRYVQLLTPVLGVPQDVDEKMAVWSYMREGVEVDCILSDPVMPGSHVPRQHKVFEALKASPELRKRYAQLKREWDGLPYDAYEAQKRAFLREIEAG